jgi:hypothetical protein
MSRFRAFSSYNKYEVAWGKYEVAWGHDHMCGFFIQVFEDGKEDPIVDKDTLFENIQLRDVVEIASEYGIDEDYVLDTLDVDFL